MNSNKTYKLKNKIWIWKSDNPNTKAAWHFFTINDNIANEIHFENAFKQFGQKRGFGSVRVKVKIGETSWFTSIFPNSKDKTYILPIKAEVRKKENLNENDEIELEIEIV